MPRDIHHIVNASSDPVVAFMVSTSPVTGELGLVSHRSLGLACDTHIVAFIDVHVSVHVPLVGAPYSTSHAWPWLLDCKNALDIVPVHFFARHRVDDGRFDTKERQRRASRLGGRHSSDRCDDMRSGFGLPVCL